MPVPHLNLLLQSIRIFFRNVFAAHFVAIAPLQIMMLMAIDIANAKIPFRELLYFGFQ